eukprot:8935_1
MALSNRNYILQIVFTSILLSSCISLECEWGCYLKNYGDLQNAFGCDLGAAANHYGTSGYREGRNCNCQCDWQCYLDNYGDLQAAFGNNLAAAANHYSQSGINEGRDCKCKCNWQCYLDNYGDLQAAFGNNLAAAANHYSQSGINEGRDCKCKCNWQCYLDNYADLQNAFGCNLAAAENHYNQHGKNEGRNCQCSINMVKRKVEIFKMKVEIVKVIVSMSCEADNAYRNDWDGSMNNVFKDWYFLNGQYSYHDSHKEDRLFKWRWCKVDANGVSYTDQKRLSQTSYDEEWTRSCNDLNGGHAAMIGIENSQHDNHKEDRIWTFKCGELDTTKYELSNCAYTAVLNSHDGELYYNCPNNGAIRSIWSQHDNHKEDRIWKFECCSIVEVTYEFRNARGFWFRLSTCYNCAFHQYQKTIGIENSQTETITDSYTVGISATIKAGYEYSGKSGSVSVTGSYSATTATEMQSSFTQSLTETVTKRCDKTYFDQWRTSLTEQISGRHSQSITVHSSTYLCTDTQPICPLGSCANTDCTQCTNGAPSAAKSPQFNNYIDDDYNTNIVNDTTFYAICGVIVVLVMINIGCACLCYKWCGNKNKNTNKYKVVSVALDTDV